MLMPGQEIFVALIALSVLPAAWLVTEFYPHRWPRIAFGVTAIVGNMALVWVGAEIVNRLTYNAWYGGSARELIVETARGLDEGRQEQVLSVYRRLEEDYAPTYENRAHFDELTAAAARELRSQRTKAGEPNAAGPEDVVP